ncbi:hypothetical protein PENSPDRAFT_590744 [Peniophora sp. CONT]|nr:hypothetical protein PENSPDRAFT_590744 [Peniophora sp. CONT]
MRDAVNRRIVHTLAADKGLVVRYLCARDRIGRQNVSYELQQKFRRLRSAKSGELLGAIPYFKNMKVMVTENTDMVHSTVNGREGVLLAVTHQEDEHGDLYAVCAYVHIEGCGMKLEGLPADVVPIYPVRHTFQYKVGRGKDARHVSVSREQLPILPAYAYTDYKSQGRSLDRVIVDIAGCKDLQSVYVMLSRVKRLDGLALLRRFPYAKFAALSLRHDAKVEMERIERLHDTTLRDFMAMEAEERGYGMRSGRHLGMQSELPSERASWL